MHTSRDELEPMVIGEYEGRQVNAGKMRIGFQPVELVEISPVHERDFTTATIARNMGLVAS